MKTPCYINLEEARAVLAELGVSLNLRQKSGGAEPVGHGNPRRPFFAVPIVGPPKIGKGSPAGIFQGRKNKLEKNGRKKGKSLDLK